VLAVHDRSDCYVAVVDALPPPPCCSPDTAQQFMDTLPDAALVWVEECGHCAHLEQPRALLKAISEFCGLPSASSVAAAAAAATVAGEQPVVA
jgi:pimeloyl-ACP methyl ester carboxylesterase